MSAEIQKARDVLARWRKWMSPDPWTINGLAVADTSGTTVCDYEAERSLLARHAAAHNCMLIVGTAGNPDLLDAIDGVLAAAAFNMQQDALGFTHATVARAVDIAAAIVAADERMSA